MNIIFQNESVVVANKPPDIETQDFVRQFNIPLERGGMVHRLDKDTSGLIVIAKKQKPLQNLQQQFRDHTIKKIYTALVYGKMETGRGSIKAEIARDPMRKRAMKVIPFTIGRERGRLRKTVTEWQVVNEYEIQMLNSLPPRQAGKFQINDQIPMTNDQKSSYFVIRNSSLKPPVASLLEVTIKTGRTHQIRVHLHYIGHPILGDPMYNTKESRKISKQLGLNRQFLHATELGFRRPETGRLAKVGEWVEFSSELPEDLRSTLNNLSNHESRVRDQESNS